MENEFINTGNAHVSGQSELMGKIAQDNVCPFCPEHLSKYHQEPIIKESSFWFFTKNQWPYENLDFHFLIIYRKHIETLSEIDPEAGKELFLLCHWAEQEFGLMGGALTMRFGNTNFSGGTVNHLHAQLIVPVGEKTRTDDVVFRLGKKGRKD